MTRKQKLKKEIDFANGGAGHYLHLCLWDMMDAHALCVWDFHNKTDEWKQAVVDSASEVYEFHDYETLWPKIIATSFSVWNDECGAARRAAEKIKKFLIRSGHEAVKDVDFDAIISEGVSFSYVSGRMNPVVSGRMNPVA